MNVFLVHELRLLFLSSLKTNAARRRLDGLFAIRMATLSMGLNSFLFLTAYI